MKINEMKFHNFSKLKGKYIGRLGTKERDSYDVELKRDIMDEMIKQGQKEKKLNKS